MSDIQVEFAFDDSKLQRRGIQKADVYHTLKKNFARHGLPCVEDKDDMLAFTDAGRREDYGTIWAIIFALIDHDWFTDCISHCVFIEKGVESDVRAGIPRAKEIMAHGMGGVSEKYA